MGISVHLLTVGAEMFGAEVDTLRLLGGYFDNVYAYEREGKQFVLKMLPLTPERVGVLRAQLEFVHYLADHAVRVSKPVPSSQGHLVEIIETDETVFGVTSFEMVRGRHIDVECPREWNARLFHEWGRIAGRIHALTKRYEPACDTARAPDWQHQFRLMARRCRDNGDTEPLQKSQQLCQTLQGLPSSAECYGLIHCDLQPGNFLVNDAEVTVIDFDECAYHWFVNDIAVALYHARWGWPENGYHEEREEGFSRRFLDSFMAGYRQENRLAGYWLKELPTFLEYRRLHLFLSALAVYNRNPKAWRSWRPWFKEKRKAILQDVPVVDIEF